MVHRIAEPLLGRLARIVPAELPIFVDRARDQAEVQALRLLRLAVNVEGEARLAAVAKPFLEAEAVALRLGDLLALFVEEHLVIEALRRPAAEDPSDLRGLDDAVDQILAGHFVIDAERDPARGPVDLPLKLGLSAERRLFDAAFLVLERDRAGLGVDDFDRHLQHPAVKKARRGGSANRSGGAPREGSGASRPSRRPSCAGPGGSRRRSARSNSIRSPTGIHSRSRSGRGNAAASHYCVPRSSRASRTGRGCGSAACRDAR